MSMYEDDIAATSGTDPYAGQPPVTPGPQAQTPDEIRREIERTRGDLSRDVDALGEAVQPGNVARRQAQKVGGAAVGAKNSLKDKIMGSDDPYDDSSGLGDRAGQAAHAVGERAQDVRQQTRRRAQGNPLAAGAIALAAGWLVGSLLPASEKERSVARTAMDNADKAQPLVDEAKSAAQEAAGNLKEPAQQAAASLKDTAQESVETVRTEGEQQAQQVKDSAQDSKETVQEHQQGA